MAYTLLQLAQIVGGEIIGDGACVITRVAPIQDAGSGDISFVSSAKYKKFLTHTRASAVIVTRELSAGLSIPVLVVNNPRAVHARVISLRHPQFLPAPGIHPRAVVAESAVVAKTASIAANVVIDDNSLLDARGCEGEGIVLADGVMINRSCAIQSKGGDIKVGEGVSLGADSQLVSWGGIDIGAGAAIPSFC